MAINIVWSSLFIIYFNTIFRSKFRWLIWCISYKIYYFLMFHYYIIILILIHQKVVFFFMEISIFFLVYLFYSCLFFNVIHLNAIISEVLYFHCICCRFISDIKGFLTIFITLTFTHVFIKRQKISGFNWISYFYNGCFI